MHTRNVLKLSGLFNIENRIHLILLGVGDEKIYIFYFRLTFLLVDNFFLVQLFPSSSGARLSLIYCGVMMIYLTDCHTFIILHRYLYQIGEAKIIYSKKRFCFIFFLS